MNQKSERRPTQNFLEMGLKIGERIVFERLPNELVHLAGAKKFHWRGQDVSYSKLQVLLGRELGMGEYSGRILAPDGRELITLYNETYGAKNQPPRSTFEPTAPTRSGLQFSEVIESPSVLMGVRAVWTQSIEPLICFRAQGDADSKSNSYFSSAKATAMLALEHPYLVTIGHERAAPQFAGRVMEVVRVTGVYGKTGDFLSDEQVAHDLEQWPVAVVLADVFSVVGRPHLVDDLGFADRRILLNGVDRVNTDAAAIAKIWSALEKREIVYRRDVIRLPGFRDPGEVQLYQRLYPRLDTTSTEGRRVLKESYVTERDPTLSRKAKELNRSRNGRLIVCEGCDLTDNNAGLFDAHHLNPIATGERRTNVADFAILCPTCHRWAHIKGPNRLLPLTIPVVRTERLPQ